MLLHHRQGNKSSCIVVVRRSQFFHKTTQQSDRIPKPVTYRMKAIASEVQPEILRSHSRTSTNLKHGFHTKDNTRTRMSFVEIVDIEFDFQGLDAVSYGFKDHPCNQPLNRI